MPASSALALFLITARCSGVKPCGPSSSLSLDSSGCGLTGRRCTEQDRHKKRDDCSETNPPRECHHRKPVRLRISGCSENPSDVVRQSAQNRDDNKANDHRQNVPAIVPASFGQHPCEKNAEDRAVSVTVNSQNDRDDPDIWINDDEKSGDWATTIIKKEKATVAQRTARKLSTLLAPGRL